MVSCSCIIKQLELCSVNLTYKILLHVHVFLTSSSNEHLLTGLKKKQLILFPENFDVFQVKKFMCNRSIDQ